LKQPRINSVIVSGNLTREPELKYSSSNQSYVNFTIAYNRAYRKDGEWHTDASFFNVVAFGETAQRFADKALKGDTVIVEGSLQQDSWEDKQGNKQSKVTISAYRVQVLGKKEATEHSIQDGPGEGDGGDIPF